MSLGYSVKDFIDLVHYAHKTYRNCQKAGEEYGEIACEVRNLHSVLRILRSEAQRPDSKVYKQDSASTKELIESTDGCKNVLGALDLILAKYEGLKVSRDAGAGKKLWQKLRFGSKMEELDVIRGKLMAHTSTISVLLDTMQIKAADRVESKIDDGFTEMVGQFEKMRKEIYNMASQARAAGRNGSTLSLLSLSTYNGDDKEVWQDFRRELIKKGFRSHSLDKHRDVLEAYMLKLDRSGILDQEQLLNTSQSHGIPWWARWMYMGTINLLEDLAVQGDPSSTTDLVKIRKEGPSPSRVNGATDKDKEVAKASKSGLDKDVSVTRARAKSSLKDAWTFGVRKAPTESLNYSLQDKGTRMEVQHLPQPQLVDLPSVNTESKLPSKHMLEDAAESPKTFGETVRVKPTGEDLILIAASDEVASSESDIESDSDPEGKETPDLPTPTPPTASLERQGTEPLSKIPRRDIASSEKAIIKFVEPTQQQSPNSVVQDLVVYQLVTSTTADTQYAQFLDKDKLLPQSMVRYHLNRMVDKKRIVFVAEPEFIGITHFPPPPREWTVFSGKSILRQPSIAFPEDPNPIREGVASREGARKPGSPRWTKISRKLVSSEVLKAGLERFEVRDDHIIVLRALTTGDIQSYARATKEVRRRAAERNLQLQSTYGTKVLRTDPISIPELIFGKFGSTRAPGDPLRMSMSSSEASDVLWIKRNRIMHQLKFPAFSIGTGNLVVRDVLAEAKIALALPAGALLVLKYNARILERDKLCKDFGLQHGSEIQGLVLGTRPRP